MKLTIRQLAPAIALTVLMTATSSAVSQPSGAYSSPWVGCCGMRAWPQAPGSYGPGMMGPGMMGGGMMGPGMMGGSGMGPGMMGGYGTGPGMMGGSMTRNRTAMMGGVPAPYASLRNPLPQTAETVEHGAKVYTANCASCHGETGYGDGPAGRTLNPRPANLAWLSRMPMSRWDPFMYWTVAEGGAPFGTAMPSFKQSLSKDDIWAVIGYIQARLPATPAR